MQVKTIPVELTVHNDILCVGYGYVRPISKYFVVYPGRMWVVVLTQPTDGNVIVYFENSPVNFRLPDAEYQVSQREFV
jgi:hypothetical protein